MSIELLNIAFKSDIKPSSLKFVLVALSDFANDDDEAYPSIQTLSSRTSQDRKTVMRNLSKLLERNIIVDTGKRVGKSNAVIVYKLLKKAVPKTGQSQKRDSPQNGTSGSPKNGTVPKTVLPSGKAHSSAGLREAVPKTGQSLKRYTEPPVFNHQSEPSDIAQTTRRFVKPTVGEISDYCHGRENSVDANSFFDFYESKGWKVGKSPMKNWQAAVRNWERSSMASVGVNQIDDDDMSWMEDLRNGQ